MTDLMRVSAAFATPVLPGRLRTGSSRSAIVGPATTPRRRPRASLDLKGDKSSDRRRTSAKQPGRSSIVAVKDVDGGSGDGEAAGTGVISEQVDGKTTTDSGVAVTGSAKGGELSVSAGDGGQAEEGDKKPGMVNFSVWGREFSFPARYVLFTVPFMWGTFGPAVRVLFMTDPHPEPSVFNSERLLLANAVYFPVLMAEVENIRGKFRGKFRRQRKAEKAAAQEAEASGKPSSGEVALDIPDNRDPFLSIRAGVELGAYVFCANVSQVIGLQTTSASRAAFLVQLQTVFIPIIAAAMGINKVSRNTWIGSITAVAGVALLSADKSHGTVSSVVGDSLEILSAIFFSMYVVRLSNYCARIEAASLVSVKLVVQALLSVTWALSMEAMFLAGPHGGLTGDVEHFWTWNVIAINVGVVAWTGLVSSALSGLFQSKAQQHIPASETAVIFATQPLWASATAALILGEAFGPKGLAGGGMIVLATIFASLPDKDDGDDAAKAKTS